MKNPNRPWEVEYDGLLVQMVAAWAGSVKRPNIEEEKYSQDYRYELNKPYPVYNTTIHEVPLSVEMLLITLSLQLRAPLKCNFKVRQEGFTDRFGKFVLRWREPQIGCEAFDNKYFIETINIGDEAPLRNPAIQKMITDLEPFDSLQVSPGGLLLHHHISTEQDLLFDSVSKYVENLCRLAVGLNK